jgi:hypothetical protein
LRSLHLPKSITAIHRGFLQHSGIPELDMSHCEQLVSVPDGFLRFAPRLASVTFPGSLRDVGDRCLCDTPSLRHMVLPDTVSLLGDEFLARSGIVALDLSHLVQLQAINDYFMDQTRNLTLLALPTSITSIGESFLQRSHIISLDLTRLSALVEVGRYFLRDTPHLQELVLPASLQYIGPHCMARSGIRSVDLSHLRLRKAVDFSTFFKGSVNIVNVQFPLVDVE